MDRDPITITSEREKWRFECPAGNQVGDGHDNWRLWNGVFCCETCRRHRNAGEDVQNVYEHLRDKSTGELVSREHLQFDFDAGQPATGD